MMKYKRILQRSAILFIVICFCAMSYAEDEFEVIKTGMIEEVNIILNNPQGLTYYQEIKEKINHYACKNYNHLVNGEVYLSFVILSNGQLRDVKIDEVKSTKHPYLLKDIAKRSIYDAAPFPSFPEELKQHPELSFNIVLAFEGE